MNSTENNIPIESVKRAKALLGSPSVSPEFIVLEGRVISLSDPSEEDAEFLYRLLSVGEVKK